VYVCVCVCVCGVMCTYEHECMYAHAYVGMCAIYFMHTCVHVCTYT